MATLDVITFDPTTEEWRDVPSYEGLYQVSNLGRVRNSRNVSQRSSRPRVPSYRILRQAINKHRGYSYVELSKQCEGQRAYIHVIVAAAFMGECPNGQEVNHKNGNKGDNSARNLEYCTHAENMAHAKANGLMLRKRKYAPDAAKG